MDVDEFRACGYRVVDWVADYRYKIRGGELPIMARVSPGDTLRKLPGTAPEAPEPFAAILQDLTDIVLPACTHSQDPRFFGHFPSVSSLASVLGDYLSTGLAQLGVNWQTSPGLTELEEAVVAWLREMVGLSAAWRGVLQDTATTGTLVALLCARERCTGHAADRGGLCEGRKALVVYASAHSHESVDKAARIAGVGRGNLRLVPVDSSFAMRADALTETIEIDRARGLQPCAVVATAGTAETTALDPVADVAAVAKEHGMWLHVDAAMAGCAMILPECRWMWEGVESADSIVINPHKWLGAAFDCSAFFVRDAEHLVRAMGTASGYLQPPADSPAKNFRDWGLPLTRQHRALKLWFLIREQGVSGLRARLRRDLTHAQWLAAQVDAAPAWTRVAPCPLQTVCVRHTPAGMLPSALDSHTLAWARSLNETGDAYVTPARLDGRWMVRVAFGSETTESAHVAELWRLMQHHAALRA